MKRQRSKLEQLIRQRGLRGWRSRAAEAAAERAATEAAEKAERERFAAAVEANEGRARALVAQWLDEGMKERLRKGSKRG